MDFTLDFSGIVAFFTAIWDWLTTGIYLFFTKAFAALVEFLIIAKLESTIWSLNFAWGIGKTVIADLNVSSHISQAWSVIPPEIRDLLTLCRLPEALLNILTALVARFVFKFVNFL